MTTAPGLTAAASTAWAASLLAVGSLGLAGAWPQWHVVLVLVAAAVLPLVLLRVALAVGVSAWAAAASLSLVSVLVAYLMTARTRSSLAETVVDLVPRLLTEPRPLAARADLLAGPVLLAAAISIVVGLRLGGSSRTAPLVGGATLYAAGLLLTAGDADPWGLLAVLLIALSLAGWSLLDTRAEPVRERLALTLPVVAGGAAVLAMVAAVPASGFEPGDLVEPPVTEVVATTPMAQLGAWAANPDAPLLRVSGDRAPLRLVVLDTYDGTGWTAVTRYAPQGSGGRADLPDGARTRGAAVEVTLEGLRGGWLPAPGRVVDVDRRDVLVDARTGTLFEQDVPEGTTYTVTGTFDDPTVEQLRAASVPTGESVERYLTLPELPNSLVAYSSSVTRAAATPYQRAVAIERAVRNEREVSRSAISGSALWRLEAFLFGEPGTAGARIGTSEQFAATFAVVARQSGLPTRVVVGFKPGRDQDDGSRVVAGADALAWPEVYFDGLGWVPFSPTPDDDTFLRDDDAAMPSSLPQPDPGASGAPSGPASVGAGGGADPDRTGPGAADPAAGSAAETRSDWWTLAGVALPLLTVTFALLGARAVRSRRHRRRGAIGAWSEVRDALVLSGVPRPPAASALDLAGRADDLVGGGWATAVAEAAERAAFGPAPEPAQHPTAEVRRVRRLLRRTVPRWRRWWWGLDPRVFLSR